MCKKYLQKYEILLNEYLIKNKTLLPGCRFFSVVTLDRFFTSCRRDGSQVAP